MTAIFAEENNKSYLPFRAAALDIGSNSCRLLIAEAVADSRPTGSEKAKLKTLYYDLKTTRLASGIEKSGRLNSQSLERTVAALKDFSSRLQEYQVQRYRMVGTSALREVSDASRLKSAIKSETGLELEIITGQQEAELIYRGASAALDSSTGGLVIDIGGGSTEIITEESDRILPVSLKMGAVRFTERFISNPDLPISSGEIKKLKETALALLQSNQQLSSRNRAESAHLQKPDEKASDESLTAPEAVGVGGTITNLAAVQQKMTSYRPEIIEGYNLAREEVDSLIELFASRSLKERQGITGLQPARADIITAGTVILSALLEHFQLPAIKVSEQDILSGLLREELNISPR